MNILIVESENDQYFVEALVKFLNTANTIVCCIDDFKYSSLDQVKLKTQIGSALVELGISKIGIILDMDDADKESRIRLINEALVVALNENFADDFEILQLLTNTNEFIEIHSSVLTTVSLACYFTNVDGNGELETLLKEIKKKDSTFADCLLEGWQDCLIQKGKKVVTRGQQGDITDKELLKLWVDFYKRFDTLKKSDRGEKTTGWKGIWLDEVVVKKGETKTIPARGKDIFDLSSDVLKEIKDFLLLFN